MARRNKLDRFADNADRENVIEPGKPLYGNVKGAWRQKVFGNDHPIVLEIGCGRGEYTVGLARDDKKKNFVGIDIKGDRIWYGSGWAQEEGLENVAFLRIKVEEIDQFFVENEVDEIWITFPGPRPKKSQAKKRLTSPRFLDLYKSILKPAGVVHLKTDSDLMFEYTLEQIHDRVDIELLEKVSDVHEEAHSAASIKTRFEERFMAQGIPIKYVRFKFISPLTKPSILSIITSLFRN